MGGEGGGSECEEGEAFSVSVSPARCRLQNEHSCFPLALRGNCFLVIFLFFFKFFSFLPYSVPQQKFLHLCFPFLSVLFFQTCVTLVISLLLYTFFFRLGSTMPVVGVASKLRQPSAVGTKPVHTALPIPSAVRAATSQGFMSQQRELRVSEGDPGLSCQLSIKSEFQQERRPDGKSRARTEESRICKVSGGDADLFCRCELFGTRRCLPGSVKHMQRVMSTTSG